MLPITHRAPPMAKTKVVISRPGAGSDDSHAGFGVVPTMVVTAGSTTDKAGVCQRQLPKTDLGTEHRSRALERQAFPISWEEAGW